MLKFRQNRTKPEIIRILFVKTNKRFGQKIHESGKLNGNIFFEIFSGDLDEKMTSAGYRRKRNKKESETVGRADNLFNLSRSSYKKLTSG